jgi:hypothetical protein
MNEDKLGTLEEAIEFDKKRNYQYTTPVEYSDFLPIWKDFIKDAGSVFNVQMVAHHFYNLGRDTAPRELSDEEIPIMTILQNAQSVSLGSPIFETDEEYEKLKKIVIAAVRWSIK